ncbi:MAG: cadherin-like beta sandwich domain-containing protein [Clostridium sp.]
MNRRLKQLITCFMIAGTIAIMMPFEMITALAGSAKISFSDPSASVGEEFSVSVKVAASEGDLGTADVVLSYDPAYIEFISGTNANGGAGSVRLVGTMDSDTTTVFSYKLKFKAIQAGNSAISVASYEIYDKETQIVDVSKVGTSTVKVAAPATYSSEAGLSSLKVSPGSLSPAFSPDVMAYSVNIGGDVNKIAVSANAKDGKAKVLVNGDSNLKVGANTVVCKVTAEDGQTVKSYKITVNKSDTAEAAVQPSDAVTETQSADALSPYPTIEVTAKSIAVLPIDDTITVPSGFAETTIQLNGTDQVQGWVWQSDEEQRYCVVYGMNENGDKGLYRYDIAEKTFQRYFEDPAVQNKYDDAEVENLLNKYNELLKDYNIRFIIMIALIIISLILLFIVINLLLKKREHTPPRNGRQEEAPTPVKRREMEQHTGGSRRRDYTIRHEERDVDEPEVSRANNLKDDRETERRERAANQERITREEDRQDALRQREIDREQRARQAKERLEQERKEDERRRYEAKSVKDEDDFEFMDLDE